MQPATINLPMFDKQQLLNLSSGDVVQPIVSSTGLMLHIQTIKLRQSVEDATQNNLAALLLLRDRLCEQMNQE